MGRVRWNSKQYKDNYKQQLPVIGSPISVSANYSYLIHLAMLTEQRREHHQHAQSGLVVHAYYRCPKLCYL